MGNTIDIGALSETLAKELSQYTINIGEKVKVATDDITKELLDNTKSDAPKRTGDYKKAMKTKTESESDYSKHNRWYVDPKTGKYRLSHLLEEPHKTRNEGKTRAFPHIKKNEEIAKTKFEERVKEIIQNEK